MGSENGPFFAEKEKTISDSLNDALLFATICIIGLPVDVHVKDGSIYSGIFYTACVDDDYGGYVGIYERFFSFLFSLESFCYCVCVCGVGDSMCDFECDWP